MAKVSAKNKIIFAAIFWIFLTATMFLYGFKIWAGKNQVSKGKLSELYRERNLLEAEKQSFDFAQKDLEQLSRMPLQPENFFSQDVTLVSELETLEKLGSQLNVRVELSGISGTVKNAAKAKTASDIVTIPYNISVRGSYPQIVNFLEYFENLPFVTTLTSLAIRSTGEGEVIMSGNALFYLKR